MGQIGILNVGAGDNKLVFDPDDMPGMIRAARVVNDMIRRGYALLVQTGVDKEKRPVYQRVQKFDDQKFEYIIADFDPVTAAAEDEKEKDNGEIIRGAETPEMGRTASGKDGEKRGGRGGATKRIPASRATGIAVGRTAGG